MARTETDWDFGTRRRRNWNLPDSSFPMEKGGFVLPPPNVVQTEDERGSEFKSESIISEGNRRKSRNHHFP